MNPEIKNKLLKIRQSNAAWLCTVRKAPFWIFPKKLPPYRPYLLLVLDQKTEFILTTKTSNERPSADFVLDNLFKMMQGTFLTLGRRQRPASLLIDNAELAQALTPQLAELDIHCGYRNSLPQMRAALLELEESANGRKPIPGLLSIPGVSVPLVAELYEAAADYYKIKPWRWLENWMPIEIRLPPAGRARYALVLGGGGETFGLSLYESLADVEAMLKRTSADQPFSHPFSWLSVILDEDTAMAIDDLDAIEQYGWPVADPHAYPMVLKATSADKWGQLPNASDLTWLAAALRVIPSFLVRQLHADRGQPHSAQITNLLSGVYGNQSIFLRFPAQNIPPAASFLSKPEPAPAAVVEPDAELEEYIQDWYCDDASHEFARQMGRFLFQFFDYLDTTTVSRATKRKHESNCWLIGKFECDYGYHDTFSPTILLGGPAFLTEFERKVSDSKYAVSSYEATWRKLEKYVRSQADEKEQR